MWNPKLLMVGRGTNTFLFTNGKPIYNVCIMFFQRFLLIFCLYHLKNTYDKNNRTFISLLVGKLKKSTGNEIIIFPTNNKVIYRHTGIWVMLLPSEVWHWQKNYNNYHTSVLWASSVRHRDLELVLLNGLKKKHSRKETKILFSLLPIEGLGWISS